MLAEVGEEGAHVGGVGNEGDDPHRTATGRKREWEGHQSLGSSG